MHVHLERTQSHPSIITALPRDDEISAQGVRTGCTHQPSLDGLYGRHSDSTRWASGKSLATWVSEVEFVKVKQVLLGEHARSLF